MAQLSMQALGQELAKPRQGLASLTETRTETVVSAAARLREIAGGETDEAMAQLFDDKIAEVCEMHTEVEAATQAIQQVIAEYGVASAADREARPLAQRLQDATAARLDAHAARGRPQQTQLWAKWCSETNRMAPAGDSDDDVQVGDGALFKSHRCTLTQKHIFELQDPVEDRHQFIWERAAIEQYIRTKRGVAMNPAQTTSPITLQELKPARRVLRAAEKARRDAATQGAQGTQEVQDIL